MLAAKHAASELAEIKIAWMDDMIIHVKRVLSLDEAIGFVNQVVASVFDADTGDYTSEALAFATKVNVLTCYAGFEQPKDLKKAYRLIAESDIMSLVYAVIDKVQYQELLSAIEEKLGYMKQMAVSTAARKIDELIHKIEEVMSNGSELVEEMQSPQFIDMVKRVEAIQHTNNNTQDESFDVSMSNDIGAQPSKIVVLPSGN